MDDIEILNSLNLEILRCFQDADAEALERIIGQEFYETDRVGRLRDRVSVLEKVRSSKFHFVVLPLKLKGATGSPVRAIAFVD